MSDFDAATAKEARTLTLPVPKFEPGTLAVYIRKREDGMSKYRVCEFCGGVGTLPVTSTSGKKTVKANCPECRGSGKQREYLSGKYWEPAYTNTRTEPIVRVAIVKTKSSAWSIRYKLPGTHTNYVEAEEPDVFPTMAEALDECDRRNRGKFDLRAIEKHNAEIREQVEKIQGKSEGGY